MKNPSPSAALLKEREELEKQLSAAKALQKSTEDLGPLYDVIAFHDGKNWRAALDTTQVLARVYTHDQDTVTMLASGQMCPILFRKLLLLEFRSLFRRVLVVMPVILKPRVCLR